MHKFSLDTEKEHQIQQIEPKELSKIVQLTEQDESKIIQRFKKQNLTNKKTLENQLKKKQSKFTSIFKRIKPYLKCLNCINVFRRNNVKQTIMSKQAFIIQINKILKQPCEFILPNKTNPAKKTLVLQLDETLVSSSFSPLSSYDLKFKINANDKDSIIYTCKRFGVDYFLNELSHFYQIIIFSTAIKQYGDILIDLIDPKNKISHRIYRENCHFLNNTYLKNLSILNRRLKDIVMIDNKKNSGLLQPQNFLSITNFNPYHKDRQLIQLVPFLKYLALQKDVRPVTNKQQFFNSRQIIINEKQNNEHISESEIQPKKKLLKKNDLLQAKQDSGFESDTKIIHLR